MNQKSYLDKYTSGYSLPEIFYTDASIYHRDLEDIFYQQWIYVACWADFPSQGSYHLVNIGQYSIFLLRDNKDQIVAFYNSCRHRGHEIVQNSKGICKKLVCPYHKWVYDFNGNLSKARGTNSNFPKEEYSLRKIHVENIEGLIYICLAQVPPSDISEVKRQLQPYIAPYDLKNTKVAYQSDIIEYCNWKLVLENNRECLHCENHPELLKPLSPFGFGKHFRKDQKSLDSLNQKINEWKDKKIPYKIIEFPDGLWFRTVRLPLANNCLSHTLYPEHASKKLLGQFTESESSSLSLWTHPNSWNHFLYDHIVTFAVFPISSTQTLLRTKWLVHKDAVEDIDYNIEHLTHVWKMTNAQDQLLAESTQRGIQSGGYKPGPILEEEYLVKEFLDWYIRKLYQSQEKMQLAYQQKNLTKNIQQSTEYTQ